MVAQRLGSSIILKSPRLVRTELSIFGQPDDFASIAVFLASDDSHWLTGEQLLAGGGVR